jgi:hypothetical protein
VGQEQDSGGPGNKMGWVRRGDWGKELDDAKFHDSIKGTDGIALPLGPPTAQRVTHGCIGGVLEQEVDKVNVRGSKPNPIRVSNGQCKVHLDEVPARVRGTGHK